MKTRSFTLIELLIVLVIIGTVVTLAIPKYQMWLQRMKAAEAKTVLRAISDAVWGYYCETGKFPEGEDGAIPGDIAVKIPSSRYFTYSYYKWAEFNGEGECQASYKNRQDLKNGDIDMYFVSFFPSDEEYRESIVLLLGEGTYIQIMDSNWMRAFFCARKGIGGRGPWD